VAGDRDLKASVKVQDKSRTVPLTKDGQEQTDPELNAAGVLKEDTKWGTNDCNIRIRMSAINFHQVFGKLSLDLLDNNIQQGAFHLLRMLLFTRTSKGCTCIELEHDKTLLASDQKPLIPPSKSHTDALNGAAKIPQMFRLGVLRCR
jgi:hypothetical protein